MSRNNIDSLFAGSGGAPKPRTPRLSFTLTDIKRENELPLDVVFEKALRLINRTGLRPGEPDTETDPAIHGELARKPFFNGAWLARVAIRAVCEAINAKGMLLMPLAVNLRWKGAPNVDLPCVRLPVSLLDYARAQQVNPRFLAEMVLDKFMENPPAKLTFETKYQLDMKDVLPGDEWKQEPPEDDDGTDDDGYGRGTR